MPRKTNRPITVAALMLAMSMGAMEMTIVSTAMPSVIAELGGLRLYAWVFTIYMLTSTVTVPIYGKLADLHGRKPVMLVGIALFLVGSMASGQATSISQLIFYRAVQGLGAGAMQPIALTIVGDIFSLKERARVQGLFGAVWGVAGLVGPILGGLIVKVLSWRWVFYINVPFGIASALLLVTALHEGVEKKKHRLDVLGALTLSAAVIALLVGAEGWKPMLLLPVSGALLFAFLAIERTAAEPIIPIDLFRRRILAVASGAGALVGGAMIATVTYVPLFVQGVLGGSPTEAGGAIAPMVIGWPIASALSGRLLPRLGFRALIRTGLFVVAGTTAVLALVLAPGVSLWTVRLVSASIGVGLGLANTALVIAVQSSVRWEQRGVATASTMFFRTIGATVAVGAMGGVLARALATTSHPDFVDQLLARRRGSELDPTILREVSGALQSGLVTIFWMIFALGLASALVSLLFPEAFDGDERAPRAAPEAAAGE